MVVFYQSHILSKNIMTEENLTKKPYVQNDDDNEICCCCQYPPKIIGILPTCKHYICGECLYSVLDTGRCPVCRNVFHNNRFSEYQSKLSRCNIIDNHNDDVDGEYFYTINDDNNDYDDYNDNDYDYDDNDDYDDDSQLLPTDVDINWPKVKLSQNIKYCTIKGELWVESNGENEFW